MPPPAKVQKLEHKQDDNNLVAVGDADYDPRDLPTNATTSAAQYDLIAKDYDKVYGEQIGWYPDRLAPLIAKYVKLGSCILDVGCGTGSLVEAMRKEGFTGTIHGFDVSPGMVDESKKRGVFSEAYVHDLYQPIPLTLCGKYDALITTAALMFVDKPGLISELVRCVKKGGQLVIASRSDRFDKFGYMKEVTDLIANKHLTGLFREKKPFSENPIAKYNKPEFDYYFLVFRVDAEIAEN